MKLFLTTILSFGLASQALAETQIHQKLTFGYEEFGKDEVIITSKEVNQMISDYNKTVDSADEQLEPFVDELLYDGKNSVNDQYWAANDYADEIAEKLDISLYLELADPSAEYTCYTGDIDNVVDYIASMTDGPYSDQMGISASKYKNVENGEVWEDDAKATWDAFDASSDDVLIFFSTSDGGEEQIEATISPCK